MSFNSRYSESIKQKTKSDAKGLEKTIITLSFTIVDISSYLNTIFYGKPEILQKNTRFKNPLDLGVIPLLDLLNSVDFCEILDYLNNQLGNLNIGSSPFDPTNQPDTSFGKIKWRFQKIAFDVQTEIDGFYNDFNNLDTPDSKIGVLKLLSKIRSEFIGFTQAISGLTSPEGLSSIDPDLLLLLDAFPPLKNIGNYINDKVSFFEKYTDYRQLTNDDVQKVVDAISKIRQYCVLIQSLNDPAAIAAQLGRGFIIKQLSNVLKDFNPQQIVPTLKNINETLKKIQNICNNIKNVIQLASVIIRVFSTLIFIFKVIIRFFKTLPAPNQFTTVGITNTSSDALNEIKQRGPGTFEVRLAQVSTLLDTVTLLLNTLLPIINEVIIKINTLITSIQRCSNPPKDLINDIQSTVDGLQTTVNELQAFLDNKKENDLTRSTRSQLGQFTINIIEEQVIEETFQLKRRYGVALNNQGIVQVQSQPTFASDDNVIINEVKLLLQQSGLIKDDSGIYTDSELSALNSANSYLMNDNINTQPDLSSINAFSSDQSIVTDYLKSTSNLNNLRNKAKSALNKNRQNLNKILNSNKKP